MDELYDKSNTGDDNQRKRASRRHLYQYWNERVKQDITHLFFCFERALSKEHGAYKDFILSLCNAMFILNHEDLEECNQVLQEVYNYDNNQIKKQT